MTAAITSTDSNLVAHARRELQRLGEDPDTIDGIVAVVQAFADCGHSGGSAPYAIAYLERLLRFEPLSPITDDPNEWIDRSEMSGSPWWQNLRHSRAMSHDGGKTYWLVEDVVPADGVTPTYVSEPASR
jgi:hypothetical protein